MLRFIKALFLCLCLSRVVIGATICEQLGYMDQQAEGDVFPRAYPEFLMAGGDGMIRFLDWNYIFSAATRRLNLVDDCEFTAMDCSPRETKGDGVIDVADVLQAVRWSRGQDGWDGENVAGGPGPTPSQAFRGSLRLQLKTTPSPNVYALVIEGARAEALLAAIAYDTNHLTLTNVHGIPPWTHLHFNRTNAHDLLFLPASDDPRPLLMEWGSETVMIEFTRLTTNTVHPYLATNHFPFSACAADLKPIKVEVNTQLEPFTEPYLVSFRYHLAPPMRGFTFFHQKTLWTNMVFETSVDFVHWQELTNNSFLSYGPARFFRLRQ